MAASGQPRVPPPKANPKADPSKKAFPPVSTEEEPIDTRDDVQTCLAYMAADPTNLERANAFIELFYPDAIKAEPLMGTHPDRRYNWLKAICKMLRHLELA